MPEGIDGKVTIKLAGVPWNQAFGAVLASQGLWYRYRTDGKLIQVGTQHEIEQHGR